MLDPGLFGELVFPELEEVLVGLAFVLVLSLFPCWSGLLTVFAMGGAWYRNGTAVATRLEAIIAIAPIRRLLTRRFIDL